MSALLKKPRKWIRPSAATVAPEWQSLHEKLLLGFPAWEGAGKTAHFIGKKRRLKPDFFSTTWGANDLGVGISGDGSPTSQGIRINDSMTEIDIATNGKTFSVVAVASAPNWATSTRMFCGARQVSPTRGWSFSTTSALERKLNFTFFGVAGYNSIDMAVADGASTVIGISVEIGSSVEFYENGLELNSVAITSGNTSSNDFGLWSYWDATRLEIEWEGIGNVLYIFSPGLTPSEHLQIGRDPFGMIRMVDDAAGVLFAVTAAAAVARKALRHMLVTVGRLIN